MTPALMPSSLVSSLVLWSPAVSEVGEVSRRLRERERAKRRAELGALGGLVFLPSGGAPLGVPPPAELLAFPARVLPVTPPTPPAAIAFTPLTTPVPRPPPAELAFPLRTPSPPTPAPPASLPPPPRRRLLSARRPEARQLSATYVRSSPANPRS